MLMPADRMTLHCFGRSLGDAAGVDRAPHRSFAGFVAPLAPAEFALRPGRQRPVAALPC